MSNFTDDYLHNFEVLEYRYNNLSTSHFTYHKYPEKGKKGKFVDDGICEVCGEKHSYVLIEKDKPKMCYKCYQAIRAYQALTFDVLKLKKKNKLTLNDCKRIVKYMKSYAKKKAIATLVVGTMLIAAFDHDLKNLK